jgi:RNA polymerase sigma-70 factor (ECF subfamily)
MINSSIDHDRKEVKHYNKLDITEVSIEDSSSSAVESISYGELMAMVQRLSPAYRAVFNLHVIDGYTHEEIGKKLGISEGTSKSNLLKARNNLRKMLERFSNVEEYAKYV